MSFNLRKRARISYYEPEEPAFDDHMYCDECQDFVYEYCSIHGSLLIIPDNKVPTKTNLPSYVTRAALTIPSVFLHLAPSIIPGAGLGIFSTLTLPRGVRFGPYRGQRTQLVTSMYCWQIYDGNRKPSHVVDAEDADNSNWMRYVNCARHWREQNLVAYQYQGQLYYRTIKIIPRFTELMIFYGIEFANILHIDLSKYNSLEDFDRVIGAANEISDRKLFEKYADIATVNSNTDSNYNEHNINKDAETYLTDEVFDFIEEVPDEDETRTLTEEGKISDHINQNSSSNSFKNDFEKFSTDKGNLDDSKVFNNKSVTIVDGSIIIKINNASFIHKKCEICDITFKQEKYLRKHIYRCHRKASKFVCTECKYKTNLSFKYKEHLATSHGVIRKYVCEDCNKIFNCQKNLTKHLRIHYIKTLACHQCEYVTNSKDTLRKHFIAHSNNTVTFKCNKCQFRSKTKAYFDAHDCIPRNAN